MSAFGSFAFAQKAEKWNATWTTALFGQNSGPQALGADGLTVRNIAHISMGGSSIRLKFSNEFGNDPLTIGEATVALAAGDGSLQGTVHPILFGGKPTTTIPQGAIAISDPIPMQVAALANVAVSIFVPQQNIRTWTRHQLAMQTNYAALGNQASKATLAESKSVTMSYFLKAIDVSCSGPCGAIATLGDSITDGVGSSVNKNHRWPDDLAARLAANQKTANMSVLNVGISGNRLLHENAGPSALARLDRDVLTQSGVKYLIVLEGINDIGVATRPKDPADPVTVEDLEWSLTQIVSRAHGAGIKVFGATLTPAGRRAADAEAMRAKLNEWIRTSNVFDGVIDFEKAVRDPQQPTKMLQAADCGDGLHPSENGYQRMADAIDLKSFE